MKQFNSYQVIYLTGPPATGKSTLTHALKSQISPLKIYAYSDLLAKHISKQSSEKYSERSMRQLSAKIITPRDVEEVDRFLVEDITNKRKTTHIVIDSHAVTKETYGFRVTPFSLSFLAKINPTLICMLYSEPSVVINRIINNDQGRPIISEFEANFHCFLQASVAINYSINIGVPVYFFDCKKPPDVLAVELISRIGIKCD